MPSRREIKDSHEDDEEGDEPAAERDEPGEEGEAEDDRAARKAARAARAAGRTRWQRLKAWFRDARLYLYAAFFAGSFLLIVLGSLSIWAPRALGPGLESWFRSVGSYNAYLFFGGFVFILAAAYLFLGLLTKRREFKRLVSTKSKGDFVHSLDRIERLAFELGSHENDIVAARKREFKIRH